MAITIKEKAYTAIFRKPYIKEVHHRNPSGLHNKVSWLLSNCKRDVNILEQLENSVSFGVSGSDECKSWSNAFYIAHFICKKQFNKLIREFPQLHWIKKYEYRKNN